MSRPSVKTGNNGGLQAHWGRSAIDNQLYASAQIRKHMFRRGRGYMARSVRRWRNHRSAERREDAVRDGMVRNPNGNGVEPGGRKLGDRAIRALG